MACVHEFGIIDVLDKNKDYGYYHPEQYNCVVVHDDIVCNWLDKIKIMKSYFHCFSRPEFGLAWYGVTLIPPESLDYFYNVVTESTPIEFKKQVSALLDTITKAKNSDKFIIHFGV